MLFIATVGRYVRRPLATIRRLVPKARPAGPVATRVPIVGTLRLRNVAYRTVQYRYRTPTRTYLYESRYDTSSCKVKTKVKIPPHLLQREITASGFSFCSPSGKFIHWVIPAPMKSVGAVLMVLWIADAAVLSPIGRRTTLQSSALLITQMLPSQPVCVLGSRRAPCVMRTKATRMDGLF